MTDGIDAILSERQQTHGDFAEVARIAQAMRALFRSAPGWLAMDETAREALDMKATKLARIVAGDSACAEHWNDDAGYSRLARGWKAEK